MGSRFCGARPLMANGNPLGRRRPKTVRGRPLSRAHSCSVLRNGHRPPPRPAEPLLPRLGCPRRDLLRCRHQLPVAGAAGGAPPLVHLPPRPPQLVERGHLGAHLRPAAGPRPRRWLQEGLCRGVQPRRRTAGSLHAASGANGAGRRVRRTCATASQPVPGRTTRIRSALESAGSWATPRVTRSSWTAPRTSPSYCLRISLRR